jgi:hypothetical protein
VENNSTMGIFLKIQTKFLGYNKKGCFMKLCISTFLDSGLISSVATYTIPKDPEQQIYDFYAIFLVRFGEKEYKLKEDLLSYFEDAENKILSYYMEFFIKGFRKTLALKCVGELYITNRGFQSDYKRWTRINKEEFYKDPIIQKCLEISRIFQKKIYGLSKLSLIESNSISEFFYELCKSNFIFEVKRILTLCLGGKDPWIEQVIPAYERLLKADTNIKKYIAIDHTFDVQHHRGTIMEWLMPYKEQENFDWFYKILNKKYNLKDERELYKQISPGLKNPFIKAIHLQTGKSMDTYQEEPQYPLFNSEIYTVQILNGWYEFPNGLKAKFKNASVTSLYRSFQNDFEGINLIKGLFEDGNWPGGNIKWETDSIKSEEYLKPKQLEPPIEAPIKNVE